MKKLEIIEEVKSSSCDGPSVTLKCLFEKLKDTPEPKYIFRGIVNPSFGVVFGPAKSGKTTLVENLLFSIAAGLKDFLGDEIYSPTPKVMLISLEEYYRNRTKRNDNQIKKITEMHGLGEDWINNIIVVDETFPRHMQKEADWKILEEQIVKHKPSVVVIDSMTRLTSDPIEDSTVATKLMKRLRDIAYKQEITLIVIHHTQKMDNRALTIASLAGSRVVGQECDFMIGVNKTTENVRYIKDVAYRYANDNSENVLKFKISDDQLIETDGLLPESKILLAEKDMPFNNSDSIVKEYFIDNIGTDISKKVIAADICRELVDTGTMSRPTLFAALGRLIETDFLRKSQKGVYELAAAS